MGEREELADEARDQRAAADVAGFGCLAWSVLFAVLIVAIIAAGVYEACLRWPALGGWAMPLGWTAASYGAVVAVVRGVTGR